ncbi:MAG: sugar ABC transporter permease [Acidimicrobiia bacterium]|nr:sugar ABC transporter permease [Acidimicrobiia bacterium]
MAVTTPSTERQVRPKPGKGVGRTAPPWKTLALFLAPAFLLYAIFMVFPLAQALFFSLFEWKGTARGGFVGLHNFGELFGRFPLNEQLPRDLLHNTIFFIGTMAIQVSLGLLFAVLLQGNRFGKQFLRTTYVLPFMISPLVVGYVWSLILNPTFGPVNTTLKAIGLDALARPWLGDPTTAFPVVILVNVWFWLGFPLLLFAAGLAAIPEDYAEAASIDGAGPWQTFRHVTMPLLTPVFGTVAILTFIRAFNVFGLVWALGGVDGGPAGATDVLGLLFYRTAFRGGVDAFGVASALAVVMFAIIFGISMLARWWFSRLEEGLT